jgi:hypothetical protein
MPAHARPAAADLLPSAHITDARRERRLSQLAKAVTALVAFVAVLVVSAVSVLLGFFT